MKLLAERQRRNAIRIERQHAPMTAFPGDRRCSLLEGRS
jgi:hypothetical protein